MIDLLGYEMTKKTQLQELSEQHRALDEFEDWLSVLKKKKAATTEGAWGRRLNRVNCLIESGNNLAEVFAASADSGWTGLFEVKNGNSEAYRGNGKRETVIQARERRNRDAITSAEA